MNNQHATIDSLKNEALIFGRYILSTNPDQIAIDRYVEMILKGEFEEQDSILKFVLNHPFWLGCVESGLLFIKRKTKLRLRLFNMFCILETMPQYHSFFLPQKRSFLYLFKLFFIGVIAILKIIIGVLFLVLFLRHE